jgi:transposase
MKTLIKIKSSYKLCFNLMYYDKCNSSFLNMFLRLLKMDITDRNMSRHSYKYTRTFESHWAVLSDRSIRILCVLLYNSVPSQSL